MILASQSPRRKHLLEQHGYDFRVIAPSDTAECGVCDQETPPEMVARLALQKASDVANRVESGIVLGCDTMVECCGRVLGKPHDRTRAEEMLRLLSGRLHAVYSGVCLWSRPDDTTKIDVAVSRLKMDSLTEEQIDAYIRSRQWEGKAGGFGYQDGHDWLRLVEGSESNVVGLPIELLGEMLAALQRPADE